MEAKKILMRELDNLAKQLSDVRLRYRYDEHEAVHVEVTPKSVFNSDKFMLLGIEVEEKFNALFPDEWLTFISDGDGMGIDNFEGTEYTLQGASYGSAANAQKPVPAHRKAKAQKMAYA